MPIPTEKDKCEVYIFESPDGKQYLFRFGYGGTFLGGYRWHSVRISYCCAPLIHKTAYKLYQEALNSDEWKIVAPRVD
jgi:hypothetical protein